MARTVGATNKPKLITWAGTDKDPALFIAKVMMNEGEDANRRLQAATALLPYVHRKLPMAVEADISASGCFTVEIRRTSDGTAPPAG